MPINDYCALLQHSMSKSGGCQLYSYEFEERKAHSRLLVEELWVASPELDNLTDSNPKCMLIHPGTKLGSMPCEPSAEAEDSYIPG